MPKEARLDLRPVVMTRFQDHTLTHGRPTRCADVDNEVDSCVQEDSEEMDLSGVED